MKKRVLATLLAVVMVMSGCGSTPKVEETTGDISDTKTEEKTESEIKDSDDGIKADASTDEPAAEAVSGEEVYYDVNLVPSVEPYKVADDFSNVEYEDDFDSWFNPSHEYAADNAAQLRQALIDNNFAVEKGGYDEFFDVYESNRYQMFPNFVTVDSLMHTYHLYFAYLMKQTEK